MHDGLYESLITAGLAAALGDLDGRQIGRTPIDAADQPHVLARHVYEQTLQHLETVRGPEERLRIVNDLVERLGRRTSW